MLLHFLGEVTFQHLLRKRTLTSASAVAKGDGKREVERMDIERMRSDLSPGAGDDPSQTSWLPARVKQLMLPSFDCLRQPTDSAGLADSVQRCDSGRQAGRQKKKKKTAPLKVQAWVTLLTHSAVINI